MTPGRTRALVAALMMNAVAVGQVPTPADTEPRVGVSGGMGVSYYTAPDVVDHINAVVERFNGTGSPSERVPSFKSAVEFFGACSFPLSDEWVLKLEYAYQLSSYTLALAYPYQQAEFSVTTHLPSLIVQYVLAEKGIYNLKVGVGAGPHFGSLSEKYPPNDDTYSGSGLGTLVEVEANTAFGDHVYAFLGANARWDFIGELKNASGYTPGVTLQFFGVGARLGFSYYF